MSLVLSDVGVLVTRPIGQAASLMRGLADLGARPISFPALAILSVESPELRATLANLEHYHLALFVSPTAVEQCLRVLARPWPAQLPAAGIGAGTARALHHAGVARVLAPAHGADSEHLLALPEFSEGARGRRVLIVRGEGGRELLAETLAARGMSVSHAVCYRRGRADTDPATLRAALAAGQVQAVTAMSAETLDHLLALAGEAEGQRLKSLPLFVPHARIAAHARAFGCTTVIATAPGEDGLVAGLVEYFAHD